MDSKQEFINIDNVTKELIRLMDEFEVDLKDEKTQRIIDKLNEIPN